jgi:tetratricopeptide (TPR) repeat protein
MQRWAHFQSEEESRRETKRFKQKISKLLKSSSGPGPVKTAEAKPSKLGRNSPCPCGSGKKYKKCCLNKDEANRLAENRSGHVDEVDILDELSNRVPDLVRAGRLDEAEAVCQQLLTRYPDQVDGLDRLAIVYEAKGERARAAEYYRKAADFMRTHDGYDEELVTVALREADRLIAEDEAGVEPSGPRCRN